MAPAAGGGSHGIAALSASQAAFSLPSDDTSVQQTADPKLVWKKLFGSTPPIRAGSFMADAIAWKVQANAAGDVPAHIRNDLKITAANVRQSRSMRQPLALSCNAIGSARTSSNAPRTISDDDGRSPKQGMAPRRDYEDLEASRTKSNRGHVPLPPASSQLLPGSRLVKLHGGRTHVVEVTADGLLYEGELFRSLSAVAKQITGTHWNGLLFFGLRKRKVYPKDWTRG